MALLHILIPQSTLQKIGSNCPVNRTRRLSHQMERAFSDLLTTHIAFSLTQSWDYCCSATRQDLSNLPDPWNCFIQALFLVTSVLNRTSSFSRTRHCWNHTWYSRTTITTLTRMTNDISIYTLNNGFAGRVLYCLFYGSLPITIVASYVQGYWPLLEDFP